MGFPPWAIGIIILVFIISLSSTVYFVLHKKVGKKRAAVGAQDEEAVVEKSITNPSSSVHPAITPLYNIASSQNSSHLSSKNGFQSNYSSSTIPTTVPSSPYTGNSTKSVKSMRNNQNTSPTATSVQLSNSIKDDNTSLEIDDSVSYHPKNSSIESPKVNLPLPPPSSSFFADKMELDSNDAHELYQTYLNASQSQDIASLDFDEGSKLSLSNIQQKAANLRSSIYQSLRRKSICKKTPPIGQFLDTMNNNNSSNSSIRSPSKSPIEGTQMSRRSSLSSCQFPRQVAFPTPPSLLPASPRSDSPTTIVSPTGKWSSNNSKKSLISKSQSQDEEGNSNKIMIDTLPHENYFSLPMTPVTPSPINMKPKSIALSSGLDITDYSNIVNDINYFNNDTEEIEEDEEEEGKAMELEDSEQLEEEESDMDSAQKAASAARRLIKSASRKSKTLSMIVTDEDAQAMFTSLVQGGDMPSAPDSSFTSKYSTVREKQPQLQKIDILGGSIRIKQDNVSKIMDISNWSSKTNVSEGIVDSTDLSSITNLSGVNTVSGKKSIRVKNRLKNMFDSEPLAGTKNEPTLRNRDIISPTRGQTPLKDLFSMPYKQEDDISYKVAKNGPSIIDEQLSEVDNSKKYQKGTTINRSLSIKTTSTDISNRTTAPSSPITVEASSPYSSNNNSLCKAEGNVSTIRKMLQSSWSGSSIKESSSNSSLASSGNKSNRSSAYMGSVGSSYRPIVSPVGSVNPRLQNQHLISLSLRANNSQLAARSRPSMPSGFMNDETVSESEGPTPTVSFSTSTVQTMIPADEPEQHKKVNKKIQSKKSAMGNLLGSRQNNKTRQPSKLGTGHIKNGKTPAQIEREKYLKSIDSQ